MTASNPKPRPWALPALFLLLAAFGIEAPEAAAQTANAGARIDEALPEIAIREASQFSWGESSFGTDEAEETLVTAVTMGELSIKHVHRLDGRNYYLVQEGGETRRIFQEEKEFVCGAEFPEEALAPPFRKQRQGEPAATPMPPADGIEAPAAAAQSQSSPVVGVLVGITPEAKEAFQTMEWARMQAELSVSYMNGALNLSGAKTRVALADVVEVPSRDEAGSVFSAPEAWAAKDSRGADLYHLFDVWREGDPSGSAMLPAQDGFLDRPLYGRTLIDRFENGPSLVWVPTFAHEIGHNLGLWHERYQSYQRRKTGEPFDGDKSTGCPIYPYGYGFRRQPLPGHGNFCDSQGEDWRTIMAYGYTDDADRCAGGYGGIVQRLQRFSNLSKPFRGEFLGRSGEHCTATWPEGPVDAVRALDQEAANRTVFYGPGTFTSAETINNICDRTAQVRDGILAALELDGCAAVPSGSMAGLRRLDLRSKGIEALKIGDFDNLTLQQLILGNNRLSTLPSGIFDNLPLLIWLSLDNNQLAALPSGIFDNLPALRFLKLEGNQLATLPSGIFDNLTRLETLYLYDNQLAALPSGIFDNLPELESLTLSNNRLTALPSGIFDNLLALKQLILQDNRLTTLPPGIFDNLPALRILFLDYNRLAGLTSEHPLFARFPDGAWLEVGNQGNPRLAPPCQPEGGFPTFCPESENGIYRLARWARFLAPVDG